MIYKICQKVSSRRNKRFTEDIEKSPEVTLSVPNEFEDRSILLLDIQITSYNQFVDSSTTKWN